jgi:GNAT superfamily N-acetyltransferase
MVTYCLEPLSSARPELERLLPFHWKEIARDRDNPKFALKPDWASYHALEAMGQFAMMVVRVDGKMVGYHIGFVRPQMHYASSLAFITDIYFVLPEHRQGRIGVQLFKETEKAMRARGVDKIYIGCKCAEHLDRTKLFERLGYSKIEYVFAKLIGDSQ